MEGRQTNLAGFVYCLYGSWTWISKMRDLNWFLICHPSFYTYLRIFTLYISLSKSVKKGHWWPVVQVFDTYFRHRLRKQIFSPTILLFFYFLTQYFDCYFYCFICMSVFVKWFINIIVKCVYVRQQSLIKNTDWSVEYIMRQSIFHTFSITGVPQDLWKKDSYLR